MALSDKPSSDSIALLAGEASGDALGASLIQALRAGTPELEFRGIGGKRMQEQGLKSMADMERLSVMGLFEPVKRLPELLKIKRDYVNHFKKNPPSVFVGIDSPDFNLRVAADLHALGIKTAHYVSPSVWAWRQKRVAKIAKSVDLMLTLFPFEEKFYQEHDVPVCYVGHPLADELPLQSNQTQFRSKLGLDQSVEYVAVLPGSRRGESERMMPVFLETMEWLAKRRANVRFLIPAATAAIHRSVIEMLAEHPLRGRTEIYKGRAQQVLGAADTALLASGTSTLEAMLLKTPMVMAYKLSGPTHAIVKRMVKAPYFALPNLLAEESLVPEFIQDDADPESLGQAVLDLLGSEQRRQALQQRFESIHLELKRNASARAADAIVRLTGL